MAVNPSDPVARMYASALLEVARDRGNIGDIHQGLEEVAKAWEDKGFRDFFTSPRLPRKLKSEGMREALGGKVPEEVLNLILLLIVKGREPMFDNIVGAFQRYRDLAENRVHAWVDAGSEFNQKERDELTAKLSEISGGREVLLHYTHRPELLGGARVRLGDRLIDTSLRTRLRKLAQHMQA